MFGDVGSADSSHSEDEQGIRSHIQSEAEPLHPVRAAAAAAKRDKKPKKKSKKSKEKSSNRDNAENSDQSQNGTKKDGAEADEDLESKIKDYDYEGVDADLARIVEEMKARKKRQEDDKNFIKKRSKIERRRFDEDKQVWLDHNRLRAV